MVSSILTRCSTAGAGGWSAPGLEYRRSFGMGFDSSARGHQFGEHGDVDPDRPGKPEPRKGGRSTRLFSANFFHVSLTYYLTYSVECLYIGTA